MSCFDEDGLRSCHAIARMSPSLRNHDEKSRIRYPSFKSGIESENQIGRSIVRRLESSFISSPPFTRSFKCCTRPPEIPPQLAPFPCTPHVSHDCKARREWRDLGGGRVTHESPNEMEDGSYEAEGAAGSRDSIG